MREEAVPPTDTRPTIFVIEEDDSARPYLKKNLRRYGFRVLMAVDVEDAREWLGGGRIHADLVLCNLLWKTPEEALRVGRELRDHAKYDGRTPLVVVPERMPGELAGTDVKVGANDWICYNANPDQLQTLLRRLLNNDSAGAV